MPSCIFFAAVILTDTTVVNPLNPFANIGAASLVPFSIPSPIAPIRLVVNEVKKSVRSFSLLVVFRDEDKACSKRSWFNIKYSDSPEEILYLIIIARVLL